MKTVIKSDWLALVRVGREIIDACCTPSCSLSSFLAHGQDDEGTPNLV